MAMTSWRARVSAWVGGFGVPGGFDATSDQRRLKGFTTLTRQCQRADRRLWARDGQHPKDHLSKHTGLMHAPSHGL